MRRLFCLTALLGLTACPTVQAVDAGTPKIDAGPPKVDAGFMQTEFTISVEVKGLEGRDMILRVNGINDLKVNQNGFATFANTYETDDVYEVTVGVQPSAPTQTCTVENGKGTIAKKNIENVVVTCVTKRFFIGGTVVGLQGLGLTLRNNNADALSITQNGAFTFPIDFPPNANFAVTVFNQPVGPDQNCTVSGGTGIVGNSDVSSVVVNCSSTAFTIGGTVTGLVGSVTIRNNGSDTVTLTANGTFAFGVPIESNNPYSVEIVTQPGPNSSCYVDGAIGVVGTSNVTSVNITCTTDTHFVGGTLTNLGNDEVVLTNNGGNALTLTANGAFRFTMPVSSGSMYSVEVSKQPAAQRCAVNRGTGTIDNTDVTAVEVDCKATYVIGGMLTGATKPVTLKNKGESLLVDHNGTFAFKNRALPGETFLITVEAQPSDGASYCVVETPVGTVGNQAVSVTVRCLGLGASCDEILDDHPTATTGKYWIDPDGTASLYGPMLVTCDMTGDQGGWMLVTPEFVGVFTDGQNVTVTPNVDDQGGALVDVSATGLQVGTNCGVRSWHALYINDIVPWSQIRSTWDFYGNGYCYSIFGNGSMPSVDTHVNTLLLGTDVIRKQSRMGGTATDFFDGATYRCTETANNFWSLLNDNTKRTAETILRRASGTASAGLAVGVSCAKYNGAAVSVPSWRLHDIWVR